MNDLEKEFDTYKKIHDIRHKIHSLVEEFEELAKSGDFAGNEDDFYVEFGENVQVKYDLENGWNALDEDSGWSGSNACSY